MARRRIAKVDDSKVQGDIASHSFGGKFLKLQEGPNYVRLLPPLEGLVDEGAYYGLHHQHGTRIDGGFRSFRCLQDLKRWCPFCAMAQYFREKGDKDSKQTAGNLSNRAQYYFNVITANHVKGDLIPDEDAGIQLAQFSNAVFKKVDAFRYQEWGDPFDEENGFWINIVGEGKGQARRYNSIVPSPKGIGPLPEWVDYDEAFNLTDQELLDEKTATEMVMLLLDQFGDLVDVEAELKKRRPKKKTRGR